MTPSFALRHVGIHPRWNFRASPSWYSTIRPVLASRTDSSDRMRRLSTRNTMAWCFPVSSVNPNVIKWARALSSKKSGEITHDRRTLRLTSCPYSIVSIFAYGMRRVEVGVTKTNASWSAVRTVPFKPDLKAASVPPTHLTLPPGAVAAEPAVTTKNMHTRYLVILVPSRKGALGGRDFSTFLKQAAGDRNGCPESSWLADGKNLPYGTGNGRDQVGREANPRGNPLALYSFEAGEHRLSTKATEAWKPAMPIPDGRPGRAKRT